MYKFEVEINKEQYEYESDNSKIHLAINDIKNKIKTLFGSKIRYHIYTIKKIK